MGLFVLADGKQPSASRTSCTYAPGGSIYQVGSDGLAWRVQSGVIRLDAPGAGDNRFASLAIAGDVIGCESMLFGTYAFNAAALTQCQLLPWPEGESMPTGDSLLYSLATAQKRAAEVVALRGGEALTRVVNLIRLLADASGSVVLPMRQDIADITDLRFETVSRIIKRLERDEVLAPAKICGVHATRSFSINMVGLAAV
jgi:CRP-like cAMP-binding protein